MMTKRYYCADVCHTSGRRRLLPDVVRAAEPGEYLRSLLSGCASAGPVAVAAARLFLRGDTKALGAKLVEPLFDQTFLLLLC